MHGMIAWFARNGVAANLLMVSILAIGFISATKLTPMEIFPDIERNIVSINTVYRGATPAEVERAINIRIEEAIADLEGIDQILSTAEEGRSRVTAMILKNYDVREALEEIKGRIDAINTLPDDAERPIIAVSQRVREVISVVLHGNLTEHQLATLSEQMRDELTAQPGITQVRISGVRPYEISIEISENNLQRYGLTLNEIAKAIRNSSQDVPAGSIKTAGGEILLRSLGQAYVGEDFSKIVLLTREDGTRITLGDVVEIKDGFDEEPVYALFDGKPSVELDVFRVGDQNAITVADTVKSYIESKRPQLPEGVYIDYWRDRSQYIKMRLQTLLKSAFQGGILIFLLLTLFLRFSVAVWVCIGIPISFMGALALMPHLGVTFNLVSLFAFILVLGIVVDDAIVTGENIFTHMRKDPNATHAAITGTQEIAIPVTFGVLTTVAAFLPLFLIEGRRGPMFAQIPLIVIPVLLFSLIESKFILPAHMKHVKVKDENSLNFLQRLQRKIADGLEYFIQHYYQPFLERALSWRYLVLAIAIAVSLLVLSFVVSGRYGFTFFPRIQSELARATLQMPRGTPVEVTAKWLDHITEQARHLQEKYTDPVTGEKVVQHVMTNVGQTSSSNLGSSGGQSHVGRVSFEITPPERRHIDITSSELVREWRKAIGTIPGAQELAFRAEVGHGGSPIDIQLQGQNFESLKAVANAVKAELKTYVGVHDIKDTFEGGKEEIKLTIKPAAEQLGLTLTDLGEQVRHAFFGLEAQRVQRGRNDVRVMVRFPENERRSLGDLESMYIRTPSGVEVPISEVADVEIGRGFASINRIDRSRTINVTAEIDKQSTNINRLTADLDAFLPGLLANYPDVRYQYEGELREQAESFNSLKYGVILVLFAIYSLLAIPFRSYVQPLIVMFIIPFSVIGAILGHMIMGMNLSIMSIMGILALSGVVVNDSLVLVDYINRRRQEGMLLEKAIRIAGGARFRPILLTSLTTFVGLTPLIFEKSTQAQFLIPMAVSLGFGILFATFLTLILIPVCYLILEDIRKLFSTRSKTVVTETSI